MDHKAATTKEIIELLLNDASLSFYDLKGILRHPRLEEVSETLRRLSKKETSFMEEYRNREVK